MSLRFCVSEGKVLSCYLSIAGLDSQHREEHVGRYVRKYEGRRGSSGTV